MNINKFDIEIQIRNWVYGAAIGFLASRWLKDSPPEVLTLAGTVVAAAIDYSLFSVKKLLRIKKEEANEKE
jgi:hypothetical protein